MPDLCTVVLSYRNEGTVLSAVESLVSQGAETEVVVVHSGGGATPDMLRQTGVRVLASEDRLTPGAARNRGIQATEAPFVSFLAADCVALSGWVEGRQRRHRAGAGAVASAMVEEGGGAAALASHLLQHSSRMPHVSGSPTLRFGVSYARSLLERHGPFPEDLPAEEDVSLNARLIAAGVEIVAAPEVATAHLYPGTARHLLRDQYRRGRLRVQVRRAARPWPLLAGRALLDGPVGVWRAARPGSPVPSHSLVRAAPLVAAGALATAAGAASARRP